MIGRFVRAIRRRGPCHRFGGTAGSCRLRYRRAFHSDRLGYISASRHGNVILSAGREHPKSGFCRDSQPLTCVRPENVNAAMLSSCQVTPRLFQLGAASRSTRRRRLRGPRPSGESLPSGFSWPSRWEASVQLIVDKRKQFIGCLRIALFDGRQICGRGPWPPHTAESRPQKR
jgi:hypothetical protein